MEFSQKSIELIKCCSLEGFSLVTYRWQPSKSELQWKSKDSTAGLIFPRFCGAKGLNVASKSAGSTLLSSLHEKENGSS